MEAVREGSSVSEADNRMPLEQELRCGIGSLRTGIFGTAPVATLGLTTASNAALVAELVVRFAGLVERDSES